MYFILLMKFTAIFVIPNLMYGIDILPY